MIILIDGFSVAFRAFYALPETLMTSEGTPTNLIHGFLSMINKVINEYKSEQLIVAWDLPGKTFRNDIYAEYKANRSPAPDNFKIQIPLLFDLLDAFNIPQISESGYEADDVLGSLAKKYNQKDQEVLIVTGDRDTFQLISKNTKILYTKKGISEIDIVDEKFFNNKKFVFIKNNNTAMDFHLFKFAKHFIVGPSSFHWWAAWLNPNKEKICVRPPNFIKPANNIDFWPENWKEII